MAPSILDVLPKKKDDKYKASCWRSGGQVLKKNEIVLTPVEGFEELSSTGQNKQIEESKV